MTLGPATRYVRRAVQPTIQHKGGRSDLSPDQSNLGADRIPLTSPRPSREGLGSPLGVVLLRLQRAKPPWASVTAVQVDKLLASWLVFVQDPLLSRPELDMRLEEALEQLGAQPPYGMNARRRPADLPRGRRHKKGSRK